MNLRVDFPGRKAMPLAAVLLCLALGSHSAQTRTNAPSQTKAPAAPETTRAPLEIPQSIFLVPTSPSEGRDPFFPNTTRLFGATPTAPDVRSNTPPSVVMDIALKGISGTREQPLAIINNQTFAAGEENYVISGAQRMRIQCVEINPQTGIVIIQIGNERRELRLQKRN